MLPFYQNTFRPSSSIPFLLKSSSSVRKSYPVIRSAFVWCVLRLSSVSVIFLLSFERPTAFACMHNYPALPPKILSCHPFCVWCVLRLSSVSVIAFFVPFPPLLLSFVLHFFGAKCHSLFRFDSPRSVSVSVSLSRLQGMRGVFLRVPP